MSTESRKIPIGISSCLLGQQVRYDGGHKNDSYINGTLGEFFEFLPYCPELGAGLGVPRPPIRLVGDEQSPRALGVKDASLDVTEALKDYSRRTVAELPPIRGYLLKRASPSCGMERVKVYTDKGMPNGSSSGLFAAELMRAHPLLPVEEEGRLGDAVLRENFIQRVFVYDRWLRLVEAGMSPGGLVDFHTHHKLIVLAHDEPGYRELGRIVANAGSGDITEISSEYITKLMSSLKKKATRNRHSNVLMHLMGYLKKHLDGDDKAELLESIDAYRGGEVPLVVPLVLLKHHFRRHPDPYVQGQYYLDPHPSELRLRNTL
ncbi:MAG: YbgA family protein [Gammaproteobacteria bacterium]